MKTPITEHPDFRNTVQPIINVFVGTSQAVYSDGVDFGAGTAQQILQPEIAALQEKIMGIETFYEGFIKYVDEKYPYSINDGTGVITLKDVLDEYKEKLTEYMP